MKKTVSVFVLAMFVFVSAYAAETKSSQSESKASQVGSSISGFFKSLNPMPFFKAQEDKYKERHAASSSAKK